MALEAPANRVQLRCYLGSVLYQPDNVRIMPNCPIEGIIKEEWVTKTNFENLLPAISNQSCNKQIRLRQCTVRSSEKRYFNDISTVADTAGELAKEMVYMNWQFLSADYYTKACLGTRYTLTTVVFRVQ